MIKESMPPLRPGSFGQSVINSLSARTAQTTQQYLGSAAPEVLTAAASCTLRDTVTLIDASAAPGNFTITIPDASDQAATQSNHVSGLIKIFVMQTTPAPGVQVTIAPTTPAGAQQAVLDGTNQVAYYIWDGLGWSVISNTGGGGPGTTTVLLGRSLFVSSTTGNDGTALPDHLELPYQTIQAAMASASSGDCVFIYPGDYAGFTAKAGVTVCGQDAEIFNGSGYTSQFPLHRVKITGTIVIDELVPFTFTAISNLQVTAPANSSAVLFTPTNRMLCIFSNVAIVENAAGNSSAAVINMTSSTALFYNSSISTVSGSETYLVHFTSTGNLVGYNSGFTGNWNCDDDTSDVGFFFCNVFVGAVGAVTGEFWPKLRAVGTDFTGIPWAAKDSIDFRNKAELQDCRFNSLCTIMAGNTGDSLDASTTIFRNGIINDLVTTAPITFVVRLRNCSIETAFDFSTPSAVSIDAQNTSFNILGASMELTAEATGLGARWQFQNCVILTNDANQVIIRQAVIPGPGTLVQVSFQNCSITGATTLPPGASVVQFIQPADTLSQNNYIFINNSLFGGTYGVGSTNALHITSGGNQAFTAPGYNANITVGVALAQF
jgi:hypothetical protein